MEWNAYCYNINTKEIEPMNIFRHSRFANDVIKAMRTCETKEAFAEDVRHSLAYYFWSKSEYEILISGLFDSDKEYKVDIYSQVMLNYDKFINYLWNVKKGEVE